MRIRRGTLRLVLMIFADQTHADHSGIGELAVGHTPNSDSTAVHGTQFVRASAANPVIANVRAVAVTVQPGFVGCVEHVGLKA